MKNTKSLLRTCTAVLLLAAMLMAFLAVPSAKAAAPTRQMRVVYKPAPEYHEKEWPGLSFWGVTTLSRESVKGVEFHDSIPEDIHYWWDMSAARDRSVLAWFEPGVGIVHVCADGMISLNPNSSWMFAGCNNLRYINFNGVVTADDLVKTTDMFAGCKKLEALDVSFFDTSKVKNMAFMFNQCRSLEELDVTGFDTSSCESMNQMFGYCKSLTELNLSGFDTAKVKNLSFMFIGCENLTELDLSSFKTSSNLYLNSMFYGCKNLSKLDISSFDNSAGKGKFHVFDGCTSLSPVPAL